MFWVLYVELERFGLRTLPLLMLSDHELEEIYLPSRSRKDIEESHA
jgi:hypothetical protein